MQGRRIRIGILEDQQLFRECLVTLCENAGMEVVVQGSNAAFFLTQVAQADLDVALVDVRLERSDGEEEEDDGGLRVVEALRDQHSHTRALVLSAYRDMTLVERCFQAGAAGFLSKLNVGSAELLSAIEQVARGEWLVPPEFMGPVPTPTRTESASPLRQLTLRERQVLGLVAAGADNLQISTRLAITERTVKAHVSNLYRKLGVQNRVEMALMARQFGIPGHFEDQGSIGSV